MSWERDMGDLPIPLRLKESRQRVGITQESLGIKIGIDEYSASARMNQYERGIHVPSYALLERCAAVLDVPVEYFYARSDEMAKLLFFIHKLSPEQRTKLIADLDQEVI